MAHNQYTLLGIDNIEQEPNNGGKKVTIQGQFQSTADGQITQCEYDLWNHDDGYTEEHYLTCGDKQFNWRVGKDSEDGEEEAE